MNIKLKLLSLLILLNFPFVLYAQNVRMINSTEQSWSGGIAGRSGTNYSFVVGFSEYHQEPLPDTLWIGEEPFKIVITDSTNGQNGNTKCIRSKKSVRFEISAGTYHDEYADRYPKPGNEKKPPLPHPPVKYKGVALLSYRYKGRQHYYTINRIMKVFPPVNYP